MMIAKPRLEANLGLDSEKKSLDETNKILSASKICVKESAGKSEKFDSNGAINMSSMQDKLELDISKNSRNNQTLPQEENEIQTESKLETLDENCLKTLLTEANLPTVSNKQEDIRTENEILDAKNQSRPIIDFLTSTQKQEDLTPQAPGDEKGKVEQVEKILSKEVASEQQMEPSCSHTEPTQLKAMKSHLKRNLLLKEQKEKQEQDIDSKKPKLLDDDEANNMPKIEEKRQHASVEVPQATKEKVIKAKKEKKKKEKTEEEKLKKKAKKEKKAKMKEKEQNYF
ncbi:DNA ligase 1-like [Drosophila hydei]|uniref:DNA ligase 1-like n=1 Tax=Drosophila hydei TaxID=7224 RepID=A0A6J2SQG1_DROHY|nr:DNA ligase 1-like [Drosophila hydei]